MTTKCHSFGPPTKHVLQSHGADCDLHKFYITEYSTNYALEDYVPSCGKHYGTGYKSNFRPGAYYNRCLDELDNPTIGRLVADNYSSVTKKHFLPVCGSDGRDPFTRDMVMRSSGFIKDIPTTILRSKEVSSAFINKAKYGIVYPKEKPLLQKIQAKDPISMENSGHGPLYMETESKAKYSLLPFVHVDCSKKTFGHKEGSGFTHACNDEPITHRPNNCHDVFNQIVTLPRPTAQSVMKSSFQPTVTADGYEKLPSLPGRAERYTGFTREAMGKPKFCFRNTQKIFTELNDLPLLTQNRIKAQHPTEYINLTNPDNRSSLSSKIFAGDQQKQPSLAQRLQKSHIGNKEPTGFTENNCQYFETFETPAILSRFNTHYTSHFQDRNPKNDARQGRIIGHVMPLLPNGFTKSSKVDKLGQSFSLPRQLQNCNSYVARSIKARDPLFDDRTYESKLRKT